MIRAMTLAVLVACSAQAAVQTAKPAVARKTAKKDAKMTISYEEYRQGGYFKVSLPKGWTKTDTSSIGEKQKIYGAEVFGPRLADGTAPRLSADYYAKDNAMYKTADAFLDTFSKPDPLLRIPGEKYGMIANARVSGLKARTFERYIFDFIPPDSPKAAKIPVTEKFAVVYAPEGFYVIRLRVSSARLAAYDAVYAKALESFAPLAGH